MLIEEEETSGVQQGSSSGAEVVGAKPNARFGGSQCHHQAECHSHDDMQVVCISEHFDPYKDIRTRYKQFP